MQEQLTHFLKELFREVIKEELPHVLQQYQQPAQSDEEHVDLNYIGTNILNGRVSKSTLNNWKRKGFLGTPFQVGRRVLYKKSEVLEKLQQCKLYSRNK